VIRAALVVALVLAVAFVAVGVRDVARHPHQSREGWS
jgi:hypothetical protein